MEKTKKELNQLKEDYENLTAKLQELTEDELDFVTGGFKRSFSMDVPDLSDFNSLALRLIKLGFSDTKEEHAQISKNSESACGGKVAGCIGANNKALCQITMQKGGCSYLNK